MYNIARALAFRTVKVIKWFPYIWQMCLNNLLPKILQKLHTKQEGESIRTTTKSPNLRFLLAAETYALHIVQFHVLDLVQRVLRSGCRQIRQLVQALLSLAHIPVQSVG